jgi:ASC-1-like (ASCH) protein
MDAANRKLQQLDNEEKVEPEETHEVRRNRHSNSLSSNQTQSTMIEVPLSRAMRNMNETMDTKIALSRRLQCGDQLEHLSPSQTMTSSAKEVPSPNRKVDRDTGKAASGKTVIKNSRRRKKAHPRAATSPSNSPRVSMPVGNTNTVPHPVYRDFALFDPTNISSADQKFLPAMDRPVNAKGAFPVVLHSLLEMVETSSYTDTIQWLQHGRSFVIVDKVRFEKEIIPVFFEGQKQYSSFHRQLNCYGFLRITRPGPDHNSFYHELFLRGRADLAAYIPRQRLTTNSVRISLDPSSEPDFNTYPKVGHFLRPSIATLPTLGNAFSSAIPTNSSLTDGMESTSLDMGQQRLSSHYTGLMSSRMLSRVGPLSFLNLPISSHSLSGGNYLSLPTTAGECVGESEDSKPQARSIETCPSSEEMKKRNLTKSEFVDATFPHNRNSNWGTTLLCSNPNEIGNVDNRDHGTSANSLLQAQLNATGHASPYDSVYTNEPHVLRSRLYDSHLQQIAALPQQHLAIPREQQASATQQPPCRMVSEKIPQSHSAVMSHFWQQQQSHQFRLQPSETSVDRTANAGPSHKPSRQDLSQIHDGDERIEPRNEEPKQRRHDRGDAGNDDGSMLSLDSCSGMVDFLDDVDL